jgi:hypothetical protein
MVHWKRWHLTRELLRTSSHKGTVIRKPCDIQRCKDTSTQQQDVSTVTTIGEQCFLSSERAPHIKKPAIITQTTKI